MCDSGSMNGMRYEKWASVWNYSLLPILSKNCGSIYRRHTNRVPVYLLEPEWRFSPDNNWILPQRSWSIMHDQPKWAFWSPCLRIHDWYFKWFSFFLRHLNVTTAIHLSTSFKDIINHMRALVLARFEWSRKCPAYTDAHISLSHEYK